MLASARGVRGAARPRGRDESRPYAWWFGSPPPKMSAAASLQLKLRLIRHVDLVADLDFDGLDPAVGNQGVLNAGRHRDDIAGAHGALLAVDDGAAHAGHNRPDLIPVLVAVVGQAMAGVEQDTDCRGFGLDIQNREGAPTLFGKPGF